MAEVSERERPKMAGTMQLEAVEIGTDDFLKEYHGSTDKGLMKKEKIRMMPEESASGCKSYYPNKHSKSEKINL